MKKFRGKYRIPSARAQWWDYKRDGAYFITICAKNHECLFGDIIEGKMHLSHVGVLADVFWHDIPQHAKNVTLGEYQVMPNHVHGILILDGNKNDDDDTDGDGDTVETRHALSLHHANHPTHSNHQQPMPELSLTPGQQRLRNPGKNSIPTIVGAYKSAVTKHAHRLGFQMEWQSRLWDNIIFSQESFDRVTDYIKTNIERWNEDKFHPKNIKPDDDM